MKQAYICACLLAVICFSANAQQDSTKGTPWAIGLTTGTTSPLHDVRRAEFFERGDLRFNLGAHLTHWFSPAFGLRGSMIYGSVNGEINQAQYISRLGFLGAVRSQTTYFEFTTQAVVNFSGMGFSGYERPTALRKWNVYALAGLGFNSFSARILEMTTGQYLTETDFGRANGQVWVLPVGLGVSYKVSPRFHIDLQSNLHFLNSDGFDGLVIQKAGGANSNEPNFGRNLDRYSSINLSFVFAIGGKPKNLKYWNPSYLQQYQAYDASRHLPTSGEANDPRVDELMHINKAQDDKINDLLSKIARLEQQMGNSAEALKRDTDGDGVPDTFDKEDTKWDLTGLQVSECGWSASELALLTEKAKRQEKIQVDGSGIALDVDRDGIPDHLDKCPTVAGTKNCNGCKPAPKVETVKILTDLQSIEFESGMSTFVNCDKKKTPSARDLCKSKQEADLANMRNLVDYLNQTANQGFKLSIVGHTDDLGASDVNLELSQARANSVKRQLESLGLASERIQAIGRGEDEPKFGPSGPAGVFTNADRSRNRRIEFIIE